MALRVRCVCPSTYCADCHVLQYIHHNYHSLETENWYDPADEHDTTTRIAHKGQRYCFLAAIVGANPTVRHAAGDSIRCARKRARCGVHWAFYAHCGGHA